MVMMNKRLMVAFGTAVVVMAAVGLWLGRSPQEDPRTVPVIGADPSAPVVVNNTPSPQVPPAAPTATSAGGPVVPSVPMTSVPSADATGGNITTSPPSKPMPAVTPPPAPAKAQNIPPPTREDPNAAEAAVIELDKVTLMLRDYRTLMGSNPVGTNAEIMQAVMGGNPKHATLGPPEGQRLNNKGELIDRWGTPYFFHQMSAMDMQIRSAGPDRVLWTADDVSLR